MRIVVVIVAAALAAGVAGCKAEPRPGDGVDMAASFDMTIPVIVDMTAVDLSCPPQDHEICDNHCDDDRNGYADDDDPACTSQVLVTYAIGPPVQQPAQRMIMGSGGPVLRGLNGNKNPLAPGTMLTYNAVFPNTIFAVHDGSSPSLSLLVGSALPIETAVPLLSTRDVCIFNHEVIVVEKVAVADVPLGGRLHRYSSDGKTELPGSVPIEGQLSACSSDGTHLYVSRFIGSNPSEIVVLTPGAGGGPPTVTGPAIPLPPSIVASNACCASGTSCCTRLLDFAWMKHTGTFLGLFGPGTQPDTNSDSAAVATFSLDGGAGPFLDAGTWHGVGEFLP